MATEEQTQHNLMFDLITYIRVGQRLTIPTRLVSKLSFCLYKLGNPSGVITFTIRKVSDDSVLLSKLLGDANALQDTATWEEVTFDTPAVVDEEVRILCEASDAGDASNKVRFCYQTTDVKADEVRAYYLGGGVYDESEAYDAAYIYTYSLVATPTVTTNPATSIEQTTATLNGTLDSDGSEACEVRFQYGETTDYGTNTEWQSGKVTGDTFTQVVRALRPGGIVYHFRAQARNSAGTVSGDDRTFQTTALSAAAHQALGRSYPLGRAEV